MILLNGENFLATFGLFADDFGGGDDSGDTAGGGGGAPADEAAGGAAQPPAALSEDRVRSLIEEATKPYKQEISDLKSTNVILQGMMRERQQQPTIIQQAAPSGSPEDDFPDKDAFTAEADANPAKAIIGLVEKHLLPKIRREIGGVKQETQGEIQLRQQVLNAVEKDRNAALEIGNGWGDDTTETGSLFNTYAEEALGTLCPFIINAEGRKMPDPRHFRPGMLETAALRAERRLRNEGKSAPVPSQSGGGGMAGQRVVQFPRARPGSSNGAPRGDEITVPKTIDDLVTQGKMTSEDAATAKSNCRKWGMTPERFVANWVEVEKENPRFGTGL